MSQLDLAQKLACSEHRVRGICAAPGTGKSLINLTTSRLLDCGRVLYLTVNKNLQSQLMYDTADSELRSFNLVGHSSYPCMKNGNDGLFGSEPDRCSLGANCPYWRDVKLSLSYPCIVSNIHNWVTIGKIDPNRFGKFDLIVLDEAHNLESLLCSLLSLKFYERAIFDMLDLRIPNSLDLSKWIEWSREAIVQCEWKLARSEAEDDRQERTSIQTIKLRQLFSDLSVLSAIKNEWIVQPLAPNKGFYITPAFASDYADQYLFRGVEHVILSSATLTNQDFIYLGLENGSFDLIDFDPGFDTGKRPFYYWPTTTIDWDSTEGQLRQAVNRIDRIIASRSALNWKGLIHSISYDHAKVISNLSSETIITHTSPNSRPVIDNWIDQPDASVLCSPVMSEGVDLYGDRCRYQIIWKVPTPYSKDPLVAARKRRDPKYPLYCAQKTILQMRGRLYRGPGDAGETFILDKHMGNWMIGAVQWPKDFLSTWKRIENLLEPIEV